MRLLDPRKSSLWSIHILNNFFVERKEREQAVTVKGSKNFPLNHTYLWDIKVLPNKNIQVVREYQDSGLSLFARCTGLTCLPVVIREHLSTATLPCKAWVSETLPAAYCMTRFCRFCSLRAWQWDCRKWTRGNWPDSLLDYAVEGRKKRKEKSPFTTLLSVPCFVGFAG